ncbi:branched-chain amino acid ABC transporter permease [Candidatus Aerophobetes bacterium]|nr:branched-chain amino acid ABC transporter permease [Candidatus Aerophobetes bacterium]
MSEKKKILKILIHPLIPFFIIFAVLPYIPVIGKYTSLWIEVMIWVIFAISFNILLGYTGLPSFGQGAFFGIGAYGAAISFLRLVEGVWTPLGIGVLVATAAAAFVGLFVCRKRGIYFALITIAFSQMFFFIAFRWDEVTGGETGLSGIDRVSVGIPKLFSIDLTPLINYYYFVFVFLVICILLIWRIVHSPFGRVLRAIKENEVRAKYVGYNTSLYKWAAFVISGMFAGLAGGLYTFLINAAFSFVLHWTQSGDVVIMSVLGGGLVNFFGPAVGAVIFIILRDILSAYWRHWLLAYGLIFALVVLFIRGGILGIFSKRRR